MSPDDAATFSCARCATRLTPGAGNFYVVKIVAVADPFPPRLASTPSLDDVEREVQELLAQIRRHSRQELLDQVYRGKIVYLCTECYRRWIEHPVGNGPDRAMPGAAPSS